MRTATSIIHSSAQITEIPHALTVEQIRFLRGIDPRTASVAEIKPLISELMTGYGCYTKLVEMGAAYRSRRSPRTGRFTRVSELWYPPAHAVRATGRFNGPGEVVFYCADSQDTAIIELGPKLGDRLTILQCRQRNPESRPHVMELGLPELVSRHNPKVGDVVPEATVGARRLLKSDHNVQRNWLIRCFLRDEITKVVEPGAEYLYTLTRAIGEIFLSSDRIDGFWYPSVAVQFKGTNLALKPAAADRCLVPETCWEVEIEEVRAETAFLVRCTGRASGINESGDILW